MSAQLDKPALDWTKFNCTALSMGEAHWINIMQMLENNGYIEGFNVRREGIKLGFTVNKLCITITGLEYIEMLRDKKYK